MPTIPTGASGRPPRELLEEVLLQAVHRGLARVEEGLRVLGDLGVLAAVLAQLARVEAVDAGRHRERDRAVARAEERDEVGAR